MITRKPCSSSWYDNQLKKDIDKYGMGVFAERNDVLEDWITEKKLFDKEYLNSTGRIVTV